MNFKNESAPQWWIGIMTVLIGVIFCSVGLLAWPYRIEADGGRGLAIDALRTMVAGGVFFVLGLLLLANAFRSRKRE